jgi:hypothetical protein
MCVENGEEIVEYCPNLESVDMLTKEEREELDDETLLSAAELIKRGLKKLSKLVINRRTIRLGTD